MAEEFVPDEQTTGQAAGGKIPNSDVSKKPSEQHLVRVSVIGSPEAVKDTIFTLYKLGFAAVGDWSPAQPAANPNEVISVLIRRKSVAEQKQQQPSKQPPPSGAIE